ncbi:MAG: hypothetical protein LBE20_07515 [Deltaproteobacteria bacterium]|nr:hypothetical protein [Deltaproteobacteria bacterium]
MDNISDDSSILQLLNSLSALDSTLQRAKTTIQTYELSNPDILLRIEKYEEILQKQREIANSIHNHLKIKNWREVHRGISLINGLSRLFRDDAQSLIYEAQGAKVIHISHQAI